MNDWKKNKRGKNPFKSVEQERKARKTAVFGAIYGMPRPEQQRGTRQLEKRETTTLTEDYYQLWGISRLGFAWPMLEKQQAISEAVEEYYQGAVENLIFNTDPAMKDNVGWWGYYTPETPEQTIERQRKRIAELETEVIRLNQQMRDYMMAPIIKPSIFLPAKRKFRLE